MIAFIDTYRDQFGVELICRVLRAAIPGFLTSRGYRAARTRPACDREIRDEQLITDMRTVHRDNFSVYGVKKMHAAMTRRGWRVGRDQTRRLMRKAGLQGAQRGKPVFTTITDPPTNGRLIWLTASSKPLHRTGCGLPISPSCGPGRGSATPRSSPTCAVARSSAGRFR
jgi:transposase InsO family protein